MFSNILNPDIVDEVVNCEDGKQFLNNLREVFIVFSRIQQAAKVRIGLASYKFFFKNRISTRN